MLLKKECGFKPVGLHERTHFGNGWGEREEKRREEKGIKDFHKTFWGVWS
jgi:hypothetical protein